MTEIEQHRMREGMKTIKKATTHDWRFYFSYLLGRAVTLSETEQFLREEAQRQITQGAAAIV